MPEVDIWLGGPEVSFDAEGALTELPAVKGVMVGEGEETFYRLAKEYAGAFGGNEDVRGKPADPALERVGGIIFRKSDGTIVVSGPPGRVDFAQLPFPYGSMEEFENKDNLLHESSRGCPFRCAYCLSAVDRALRYRDLEAGRTELGYFLGKAFLR